MPYLTAERSIHVHRVSSTQITTFVHDLTDNSINVNGTAVIINKIIRIWPIAGASSPLQEESRFFEVIFNGFAFFASLRLKRCLWMKTI